MGLIYMQDVQSSPPVSVEFAKETVRTAFSWSHPSCNVAVLEAPPVVFDVAGKSPINRGFMGKSTINAELPIAMFDCQRATVTTDSRFVNGSASWICFCNKWIQLGEEVN